MKTKEKYEPNLNQNNKLKPMKATKVISDDPLLQFHIDSQEQTVYKTEDKIVKKRDKLYFARLGARLGEESARRIRKEREKRYNNKQAN